MMRQFLLHTAIFAAALAATCCTPDGNKEVLTVDSALVTEYPDSALNLLQKIDMRHLNRNDRARSTMLMGLAKANKGDTTASREYIDKAIRYFERHGSSDDRAEAWYSYASAYHQAGNLEEAIRGYTQSAIFAEKSIAQNRGRSNDIRYKTTKTLLVAVYHTLGILYFEQGQNAVEPFAKAVEAARSNNNAEQEGYSRFMLSAAYCANGDYASAIETLAPLVEACDTIPFRYFAQQVRLQNLLYHTYLDDWSPEQLLAARDSIDLDEIRSAPLSYGTAVSDDTNRTFYDVASGIIFQRNGQLDSARYYIERTLSHTDEFHQGNVDLYKGAAQIYHETGDNARAYDFTQKYIEAKDSLFEAQRGAQVAELERRFRTANEVALREASLRYRAWIAALVAALVLTTAVWVVMWYRRKLRRRDEQLSESLALLDSYRESHDSLTSRLDASNEREAAVKRLLEGRVAAVRDIAATCYTYGDGERLTAKMRELALSPAMLKDVVDMADLYSDRAVTRLREQFPDWTNRNYDFAALVVAGFSPQEICVMLDMSLNGVYTLKSKLKRRIAESQARDRDSLMAFFS